MMLTKETATKLRETLSVSWQQIKHATDLTVQNPLYKDNLLLAIAATEAASLAIYVKGQAGARDRWNYARAQIIVKTWQVRYPELFVEPERGASPETPPPDVPKP